jgi:hypothetical protein
MRARQSARAYKLPFKFSGIVELFPAKPTRWRSRAGCSHQAGIARSLAANWRAASVLLRLVMVILVVGLVTVNAGGTFARPIEGHLAVTVAAATSVGEWIGVLDARVLSRAAMRGGAIQRRSLQCFSCPDLIRARTASSTRANAASD